MVDNLRNDSLQAYKNKVVFIKEYTDFPENNSIIKRE